MLIKSVDIQRKVYNCMKNEAFFMSISINGIINSLKKLKLWKIKPMKGHCSR